MSFDQRHIGNVKVKNGTVVVIGLDLNNVRASMIRFNADAAIACDNDDHAGFTGYGAVMAAGENMEGELPVFGNYDDKGELKSIEIRFKED